MQALLGGTSVRRPDSPCFGCTRRKLYCHAMCVAYAAFQSDVEEYKKTVSKNKKYENEADRVAVARSDRANKVVRRRK